MPSAKRVTVAAGCPVYSLAFIQGGATENEYRLVLGGGGGSSKTGVRNKVCIYAVRNASLELLLDFPLAEGDDAPMCLATHPKTRELVAGINEAQDTPGRGNLQRFTISDNDSTVSLSKVGTSIACSESRQEHHYQRAAVFSADGTLAATGNTDGSIRLLQYPDLGKMGGKQVTGAEELYDIDFNQDGTQLAVAASRSVTLWATRDFGEADVQPVQRIANPTLQKDMSCAFRFARFGRAATADLLVTAVNGEGSKSRQKANKKAIDRQAFLSTWEAHTGKLVRTQDVGKRPITAIDLAASGRLLAVACSDLRVGVYDVESLQPLLSIAAVHTFPVTAIRFSPSSSLLVTGSADNTVSVVTIDEAGMRDVRRHSLWLLAVFACLLALFAAYAQQDSAGGLRKYLRHIHS